MLREVVLVGNLVESDEGDFDNSKNSIFSSTQMVGAFGPGTTLQLNPRGVRTFINVLVFFWATFFFVFKRQRSAASPVGIS